MVAALVCMTTMTRMVDEQRTQIGVLKAMGYTSRAIMGKFIFYSGSAATIGSVIGFFFGSTVFPKGHLDGVQPHVRLCRDRTGV